MELTLEGKVFRRVGKPLGQLFVTLSIGWMFFEALSDFTEEFTVLPFSDWSGFGIFANLFMIMWFCLLGSVALSGLHGLHTVQISREGVRIKLGPITIRDLDVTEIKTVVRIAYKNSSRLVLLTDTAEELREKSRSFADKRKLRHQDLRMKDHARVADNVVKGYVSRNLWKNRFWMEWSSDLERELRKNLTTTIFIV